MKFYLKQLPNGRIYLSQITPTEKEEVLEEIDAEAWIAAREEIHPDKYVHVQGHGYFT